MSSIKRAAFALAAFVALGGGAQAAAPAAKAKAPPAKAAPSKAPEKKPPPPPGPPAKWLTTGGEGSALAFDAASIRKDKDGKVTLLHAVFSSAPMPAPDAIGGGSYNGLVGELTIDCKAKSARPGEALLLLPDGKQRPVPAPPNGQFAPIGQGDARAYFYEIACDGRRPLDLYPSAGGAKLVETLKRTAGQQHVGALAKKGWTFALGDASRLVAIDTSSTKRAGAIVTQNELSWMRQPQTTAGKIWRYNELTVQYDCAAGKRRVDGPMQVFASDDKLVHEELVTNGPWTPIDPNGPAGYLLQMACKDRKLLGLPSGSRAAALARLKEIASLQ